MGVLPNKVSKTAKGHRSRGARKAARKELKQKMRHQQFLLETGQTNRLYSGATGRAERREMEERRNKSWRGDW